MNSPIKVEETLERLRGAWPSEDSLVKRVLQGIESQPHPTAIRSTKSRLFKRVLGLVTTVAAVVIALDLVIRTDHSVYAQVRDAVKRARTFQMTITIPAQKDQPAQLMQGLWYERGVGFREEDPSRIMIGDAQGIWRYSKEKKLAVQSRGRSLSELVNRVIETELGQQLKDVKYERYPAGDQVVDGRPCQAHLLKKVERQLDREVEAGNRRFMIAGTTYSDWWTIRQRQLRRCTRCGSSLNVESRTACPSASHHAHARHHDGQRLHRLRDP